MCKICSKVGGDEKCILEGKILIGYLVNVKILVTWILKKWVVGVWMGFNWLRTKSKHWLL
jgi:hypothetical protein